MINSNNYDFYLHRPDNNHDFKWWMTNSNNDRFLPESTWIIMTLTAIIVISTCITLDIDSLSDKISARFLVPNTFLFWQILIFSNFEQFLFCELLIFWNCGQVLFFSFWYLKIVNISYLWALIFMNFEQFQFHIRY